MTEPKAVTRDADTDNGAILQSASKRLKLNPTGQPDLATENMSDSPKSQLIELILRRQGEIKAREEALENLNKYLEQRGDLRQEKAVRTAQFTSALKEASEKVDTLKSSILESRKKAYDSSVSAVKLDPAAFLWLKSISDQMERARKATEEARAQLDKVPFDSTNTGRKLVARARELGDENEDLKRQIKIGPYARLTSEIRLLRKHNELAAQQNDELHEYASQLDDEVLAATQKIIDIKKKEGEIKTAEDSTQAVDEASTEHCEGKIGYIDPEVSSVLAEAPPENQTLEDSSKGIGGGGEANVGSSDQPVPVEETAVPLNRGELSVEIVDESPNQNADESMASAGIAERHDTDTLTGERPQTDETQLAVDFESVKTSDNS